MSGVFELFRERRQAIDLEPLGVIDIGSNSVRLVIYEGAVRSAAPLFNEKVLCGLGREVASTKRLGEEATSKALAALVRFRTIARILGTKNLRAVATAAVREAEDGAEFIARGEAACGTNIEVLSGEREAALVAQGLRMGFRSPNGIAGDLGGGSLELINIDGAETSHSVTTPLGGLRLIDATGHKIDKVAAIIDRELDKLDWLERGADRPFYAVGGTWRAMAKVYMEAADYPLRVMHGLSISTSDMLQFCQDIRKSKKLTSLAGIQAASRARREVLPFGAYALERVIKRIGPSEIIMSVFGIREGILYDLLPRYEQAKDPLMSFCERFAQLRSRSFQHGKELCAWTDKLFSRKDLKETDDEIRERHAACLISDIGWRSHPDYRGEQSLNLIAHSGMTGIDHPGRIFLALTVYFRHVGVTPGDSEGLSRRLRAATTKRAERRARIVGAAIRCAHMLSVGMPNIIDETHICYEKDDRLVLHLPQVHAGLDGDRLRRRLDTLAELVDCSADIHIEPM